MTNLKQKMEILKLNGAEARAVASELAELRLKVFWDFPYLYEGTLDYEKKYLETYFKAKHSFVLVVKDKEKIVGATTGIWAKEEEESFKKPLEDYGLNTDEVFYFGESVLLPQYRGLGLGKIFMEERESYARSLGFIKILAFCSVERPIDHPLRPADYRPLDEFWRSRGFIPASGLTTEYVWKDRHETHETSKKMNYWLKYI